MKKILCAIALMTVVFSACAEEIGEVTTVFKLIGSNHKIIIEAFDDPSVPGVACHLSRAKTGGVKGMVGLAEDTSDSSITCRQIAPIDTSALSKLKDGESVFKQSTSLIFKSLQVVRFYDKKRNVLVYLSYSDRLIEGSPKNSISSVPIVKWD